MLLILWLITQMDFMLYSYSFQKSENFYLLLCFCLIIYSNCTVMVSCVKDFFLGGGDGIHTHMQKVRERGRERVLPYLKLDHIRSQTKITIVPKSNLVTQWVFYWHSIRERIDSNASLKIPPQQLSQFRKTASVELWIPCTQLYRSGELFSAALWISLLPKCCFLLQYIGERTVKFP